MSFVAELEPRNVWRHFDEILKIPRGSKNEQKIREYVIGVAQKSGLSYKQDAAGNLVVYKPASPGREAAAALVLQCHLDMVNDKNADVQHDFEKDPIIPQRDGEYIKATGTTLGSDNGIGIASALAVMEDKNLVHGPLELLFTIDEETGLTGASNLAKDLLTAKRLINLDTEEEGALYVGCSGGAGSDVVLPLKSIKVPKDMVALELKISGLQGGHSGVDIHLQRGNANKLLARALYRMLIDGGIKFHLASFAGGNKHNAIPREAFVTVVLPRKQQSKFVDTLQTLVADIQEEYKTVDPAIQLTVTPVTVKQMWDAKTTHKVISLLHALPHGVIAMSNDIPGLVETSTNLAIVTSKRNKLSIHCSTRSSVQAALQATRDRIRAIAEFAGAKVKEHEGYPGWKPNLNSEVLKVSKQVHQELFGVEPAVKAIHAGLECGIIGEKYSGMDMVSMGPQIEFPHSPSERVKVSSVGNFYRLLVKTMERLAI
ncbi:MAG: aminoacyl-histidine dipeptidase [candidate division KSB1 bacterium]|nr:aminoacyl-histidine dipeptidase [candidate division KSB1 bacterium]MDZ7300639.1 aminoacyl-histidine dipeptidase [candidate division KSB1 bacterium]MDZ7309776.1 aminoacyl-histidine dipeptidase [candidate division KSB1 bacterium]